VHGDKLAAQSKVGGTESGSKADREWCLVALGGGQTPELRAEGVDLEFRRANLRPLMEPKGRLLANSRAKSALSQ